MTAENFKVDEKVRVKKHLKTYNCIPLSAIQKFRGKIVTISMIEDESHVYLKEDKDCWFWGFDMLEKILQKKIKPRNGDLALVTKDFRAYFKMDVDKDGFVLRRTDFEKKDEDGDVILDGSTFMKDSKIDFYQQGKLKRFKIDNRRE